MPLRGPSPKVPATVDNLPTPAFVEADQLGSRMMLAATDEPTTESHQVEKPHPLTLIAVLSAIALTVVFGFVEVSVSTRLAVPGRSILVPTVVVALVALALLGLGILVVRMLRVRSAVLVLVVLSSLIGFGPPSVPSRGQQRWRWTLTEHPRLWLP